MYYSHRLGAALGALLPRLDRRACAAALPVFRACAVRRPPFTDASPGASARAAARRRRRPQDGRGATSLRMMSPSPRRRRGRHAREALEVGVGGRGSGQLHRPCAAPSAQSRRPRRGGRSSTCGCGDEADAAAGWFLMTSVSKPSSRAPRHRAASRQQPAASPTHWMYSPRDAHPPRWAGWAARGRGCAARWYAASQYTEIAAPRPLERKASRSSHVAAALSRASAVTARNRRPRAARGTTRRRTRVVVRLCLAVCA